MNRQTRSFQVTYDQAADAAYIYLDSIPPGGVAFTIPVDVPHGSLNLDIDRNGKVAGIEVLSAVAVLPDSVLLSRDADQRENRSHT